MLLNQISPADEYSQMALRGFLSSAPILKDMEFYSRTGPADSVKDKPTAGEKTKITRSLNEDNSPTAGSRTYSPVTKKIISYDAKVDKILEQRNEDVTQEIMQQLEMESEEAGYVFQDMVFNGDDGTDSEDFDGMLNLVSEVKTFETNGIPLPVGNSDENRAAQQKAIEYILKGFASIVGGATHAYLNEYLKIRILTIAKALGYYRMSKDELGNEVDRIGQTIIRGAGYDRDGNPLLPFTETCGTNTKTSPILTCRWAERKDLTALTSKGLMAEFAGKVGNFYTVNVNMDAVMHLQNAKALTKIKGFALEF